MCGTLDPFWVSALRCERQLMKIVRVVLILILSSMLAAQSVSEPQANPDIPKGMRQYFFALLVKGPKFSQAASEQELDHLQAQHLAYIRSQREAGKYSLSGPFLDDGTIRGILIINAGSADEARNIVNKDPMVKIGRLAVEIHPAMLQDVACVSTELRKAGVK